MTCKLIQKIFSVQRRLAGRTDRGAGRTKSPRGPRLARGPQVAQAWPKERIIFVILVCDDFQAEIINCRVYSTWRRSGIAFEIRDGTYNVPNFTLASGMVFKKVRPVKFEL